MDITVTGLSKTRMEAIEDSSIVDGDISGDNLVLTTYGGTQIVAGNVRGASGSSPSLRGLSTSSLTIGTGSKTFAISPAMTVAFPIGTIVKASNTPTAYMVGIVTAATSTSVTINVTEIAGSGTLASWTLTVGAFKGADANLTGAAGGVLTGNYPNPSLVDSGWISFTNFFNSWVNYGDARTAQYRKLAGFVFLRGIIKNGNFGGHSLILPSGFRPGVRTPNDAYFPCASNNAYGGCSINAANGQIIMDAGSNVWFDLSGIRFIADS